MLSTLYVLQQVGLIRAADLTHWCKASRQELSYAAQDIPNKVEPIGCDGQLTGRGMSGVTARG